MRFGYVQEFAILTCRWMLPSGLVLGLALGSVYGCKKKEADSCEKACAHASSVVLDMVAAQGTLNSRALTDRSEEMQRSCQAECREGGLDPVCLAAATNYDALQKCSAEALSAPAEPQGRVLAAPKPATEEVKAPVEKVEEPAPSKPDVIGQPPP